MAAIQNTSILLVTIFFLFNCGDYNGQTTQPQKISFEQVEISKKDGCDDTNSDYCAEIILEYPVFSITENKKIETKINNFLKNEMLSSVFSEDKIDTFDELISGFFDEYNQFRIDVPDSYQQWYIERFGSVIFYNDDFISLRITENSYLGGAHPNSFTVLTVFDLKNGNKLTLQDIFIEGYKTKINQIAEKEFRKLLEMSDDESLDEAGFWFDDNRFSINDNFAISDAGLTFYYNNYEITAYAYGPTELIVPLAKISELILEDGILAEFMKQ